MSVKDIQTEVALLGDFSGQQQLYMKSIKLPFGTDLQLEEQQTGVMVPLLLLLLHLFQPPAPTAAKQALLYTHPRRRPTSDGFLLLFCAYRRVRDRLEAHTEL